MKYTPKELTEEVNIPKESPLLELAKLLGGVLGIIIALYLITGFAVDILVAKYPDQLDNKLTFMYSNYYKDEEKTETDEKLQEILNNLTVNLTEPNKKYRVHQVSNSNVNALALPGGNIIVYSALLKEIQSENELSYVLAHELGHYIHNDHLRSLGRGLVIVFVSAAVFGENSSITNFLMNSMHGVEMKFSQQQEINADLFAIDLLNVRYGHVAGSTDFLEKRAKKEKLDKAFYFFSTHPHPIERLNKCKAMIINKGYLEKEVIPLKFDPENLNTCNKKL